MGNLAKSLEGDRINNTYYDITSKVLKKLL